MAMDEETRLLGMLRRRLGQFERKVTAYREDLVDDFQLFYKDLLRDVAPPVASKVRRTISRSLSAGDYPLLNPELPYLFNVPDLPESPPELAPAPVPQIQRHILNGVNPPPLTATTSTLTASTLTTSMTTTSMTTPMTTPMTAPMTTPITTTPPTTPSSAVLQTVLQHSPDSPQSREMALQGLFTPSYLPLLESSPQQAKPRPAPIQMPSTPTATPGTVLLPAPGIVSAAQGVTTNGQFASSDSSAPVPVPTTPRSPEQSDADRASNDDSNSSVVSDRSEPKTPRSALRRSSTSSNKTPQSPRRVRFDFMGAEVLPTASPQPTDFMAPRPFSPVLAEEPVSAEIILGEEDDEHLPPPRKISSSEALRALSRAPLDETTVWTVVNANPDEILVEQEDLEPPKSSTGRRIHTDILPAAPDPPSVASPLPIRSATRLGSLSEEPEEEADDESSEEEFLSMAKPKPSSTKQTPPDSLSLPGAEEVGVAPEAKETSDGKMTNGDTATAPVDDLDQDDEDVFQFDQFDSGLSAPPKPRSNPLPIKEEEDEEEEQVDQPGKEADGVSEIQAPLYATSPAVPIARQSAQSGPITPTRTKFQTGSVGSYKGRPVIMPVVRNPEVHTKAASLGQFNTFVGGLDGRSGMDEGDLSSFRASVANTAGLSGTPRSFTERLLMEEAALQRANHSDPSRLQ